MLLRGTESEQSMTQEAQHQLIGSLVCERRDASIKLSTLQHLAKQKAAKLRTIADYLGSNPHRLWLERKGSAAPTVDRVASFSVEDVDGIAISELTDEIREAEANLNRLDEECRKVGL